MQQCPTGHCAVKPGQRGGVTGPVAAGARPSRARGGDPRRPARRLRLPYDLANRAELLIRLGAWTMRTSCWTNSGGHHVRPRGVRGGAGVARRTCEPWRTWSRCGAKRPPTHWRSWRRFPSPTRCRPWLCADRRRAGASSHPGARIPRGLPPGPEPRHAVVRRVNGTTGAPPRPLNADAPLLRSPRPSAASRCSARCRTTSFGGGWPPSAPPRLARSDTPTRVARCGRRRRSPWPVSKSDWPAGVDRDLERPHSLLTLVPARSIMNCHRRRAMPDEPPIRVRNGSMTMTLVSSEWKASGQSWILLDGTNAGGFIVVVEVATRFGPRDGTAGLRQGGRDSATATAP